MERAVAVALAAWCLLAGAGASAAPAQPPVRAAVHPKSSPVVRVDVVRSPTGVRVRIQSARSLGRHFLSATGRAGDVRLRVPGSLARACNVPVGVGSIRCVSARPGTGEVVILVERDAPAGYRSAYSKDRRTLVLEVDRPTAAQTPVAGPATPRAQSVTVAFAAPAPPVSAAPAARPRASLFELPQTLAPRVVPSPVLRRTAIPQVVAAVPGNWQVYGAQDRPRRLVTLDFVSADIQDVLKALAIQSGTNILVAPKVEGKVTVGLRNVTPEQALEYIVRLGGLAYGREDETHVVATLDQIEAIFPPGTRGTILFPPPAPEAAAAAGKQPAGPPKVVIVRLEKLAAAAALPVVQQLVPGMEVQTPEPKLMVLIGTQEQVTSAESAIKMLDAAIPAPPKEAAVPGGTTPVEQAPAPKKEVEIEVYSLKHVNAADAGRLLKGFMASNLIPEVVVVPAPAPAYPVSKEDGGGRTTVQKGGQGDTTEALLSMLYGQKEPIGAEGTTGAAGTAPGAGQAGAAGAKPGGSTVVIPEGSTSNTLLLIGPREDIATVRGYLDRIDVAPKQVMIDLKVTDVSLSDEQQLGVMWSWSNFGLQEIDSGGTGVVPELQLGRFGHAPVTFSATLEAMLKTQKARLLANPRVAVLDGRTASIHVGDTVRYLSQRTSGINGTTVSIGEENVGVVVTVAPRIGGDNVIVLDVRPKVNVIIGYTPTGDGGQVPNTSERSVQTVVRLRDGETLAIGGLIRDEDTAAMQKVPGLGDLPLVGELFKFKSRQRRSSEVLIFITPTIVPDTD